MQLLATQRISCIRLFRSPDSHLHIVKSYCVWWYQMVKMHSLQSCMEAYWRTSRCELYNTSINNTAVFNVLSGCQFDSQYIADAFVGLAIIPVWQKLSTVDHIMKYCGILVLRHFAGCWHLAVRIFSHISALCWDQFVTDSWASWHCDSCSISVALIHVSFYRDMDLRREVWSLRSWLAR